MKQSLNLFISAVIVSAFFITPAFAASTHLKNTNTEASSTLTIKNHKGGVGKKEIYTTITGHVSAVNASSFEVETTNGSSSQSVTVQFDAKTKFINANNISNTISGISYINPTNILSLVHSKSFKKPATLFSTLTSSDITIGQNVLVRGVQSFDNSIMALFISRVQNREGVLTKSFVQNNWSSKKQKTKTGTTTERVKIKPLKRK